MVPGLWKHNTRPIQFTLVVDNFGVKYVGEKYFHHLQKLLKQHYVIKFDWSGQRYIGITLLWDYHQRQVHLTMPGYTKKALKLFQHNAYKKQNMPYPMTAIKYGAKQQYAQQESTAPPLDENGKKFIQQVCGKFLSLGQAVNSTLLCPISAIAAQLSKPTKDTMNYTTQFLDYVATQEEAILIFSASGMKLAVHSDASYLSEPKARSRVLGF